MSKVLSPRERHLYEWRADVLLKGTSLLWKYLLKAKATRKLQAIQTMQRTTASTESLREKRKTRNSSKSERKNSVSDIKDFFTNKMAGSTKAAKQPNKQKEFRNSESLTPETTVKNAKDNDPASREQIDNWNDAVEKEIVKNTHSQD